MKTKFYSFAFALFALFALGENAFAQATCHQGCSLGNSLVTNGDFQSGATGFSSDLNPFVSCGSNQYFITADANAVCGPFINTPGQGGSGNYMAIDGSGTPNQNVWYQTVSVVAGTTYEFAYWLYPSIDDNLPYRDRRPTLDLIAGGSVISSIDADNYALQWNRICGSYTATSTGTITLQIRQTNSGTSGWDYGLDEISFSPVSCGCDVSASFSFQQSNCTYSFTSNVTTGPGTTVLNYEWTFGDGYSSNDPNPTHLYSGSGLYTVCLKVTAFDGEECCVAEFCEEIEVQCKPEPCEIEASFDVSSDGCDWSFAGNLITSNTTIIGWYWDFGDGTTGLGQFANHTYNSGGSYVVCLTVIGVDNTSGEAKCCSFRICQEINVRCEGGDNPDFKQFGFGSDEAGADKSLQVFPNPASGLLSIEYVLEQDQTIELYLIDMKGATAKVLVNGEKQAKGTQSVKLETNGMPEGLYVVSLKQGDKLVSKKVMIKK